MGGTARQRAAAVRVGCLPSRMVFLPTVVWVTTCTARSEVFTFKEVLSLRVRLAFLFALNSSTRIASISACVFGSFF